MQDITALYKQNFNAQDYVKNFLGPDSPDHPPSESPGKASVDSKLRVALSRLNISVKEVDQKIHELVIQHSNEFLESITNISVLHQSAQKIHKDSAAINESALVYVTKLSNHRARQMIHEPLESIRKHQEELKQMHGMDELITRVESVMHVFHRLISIMDDVAECDITVHVQDAAVLDQHATKVVTASLLLEELDILLPHGLIFGHHNTSIATSKSAQGVLDLDIVKPYVSQINPMKTMLREQIENLLLCGLRNLSPSLLGAALQAACSLGLLNIVMQNLLNDLTDVLTDRTNATLDLFSIGKELGETQPPLISSSTFFPLYSARDNKTSAHETQERLQKWSTLVWQRIRTLIVDELAPIYIKVYMLERVLSLKQGKTLSETYLGMISKELKQSPTDLLWTSFCTLLESVSSKCMQESDFWKYIFVRSFPKFLSIFHELLSRVSMFSDHSKQIHNPIPKPIHKYLSNLSREYLICFVKRWEEAQHHICSCFTPSNKNLQNMEKVVQLIAMLRTDIEECVFDKILLQEITQTATDVMCKFINQLRAMICQDESAFTLTTQQFTQSQSINVGVGQILKQIFESMSEMNKLSFLEVKSMASETKRMVTQTMQEALRGPLLLSFGLEMSAILGRIHRLRLEATAIDQRPNSKGTDTSAYMLEFCNRVRNLRTKFLPSYILPDGHYQW